MKLALLLALLATPALAMEHNNPFMGAMPTGAETPRQDLKHRPNFEEPPMGVGVFRVSCEVSHLAKDDPIVFPGESGRSHLHIFAGNLATDENSTNEKLLTTPGTCNNTLDHSAYWVPDILRMVDAIPEMPVMTFAYYRSGGIKDTATIQPIPAGLRMIAGNTLATEPQDTRIVSWSCVDAGGGDDDMGGSSTMPEDCGDKLVRVKVFFPNCWNGRELDTPNHQDHMNYAWADDGKRKTCPATHPVPIPELQVGFRWKLRGGVQGTMLACGNKICGHADFMNGWVQTEMERLTNECIRARKNCVHE